MIEVLQDLLPLLCRQVEPENVGFTMRDPDMGDDARLARGQKGFARLADSKRFDILRAEIIEKLARNSNEASSQTDFAAAQYERWWLEGRLPQPVDDESTWSDEED